MYKFEPTTPKAVEEREVTISFTRLTISALITYFKIYIYILHGNGGKRADVSPDSLKPQYTIFFLEVGFSGIPQHYTWELVWDTGKEIGWRVSAPHGKVTHVASSVTQVVFYEEVRSAEGKIAMAQEKSSTSSTSTTVLWLRSEKTFKIFDELRTVLLNECSKTVKSKKMHKLMASRV